VCVRAPPVISDDSVVIEVGVILILENQSRCEASSGFDTFAERVCFDRVFTIITARRRDIIIKVSNFRTVD